MGDVFDGFQKFEPEPVQEPQGGEPTGGQTAQITGAAEPPTQTGGGEPPKVDGFIENFNKRYETQYKGDEDIKALFGLPSKVAEYETKYKDYDDLKKSNEKYKTDLENLSRSEAEKYLNDPIMQKAWVVKELKAKYPNSDVSVLTDLAMSDTDKMSDLDILAKEVKMKLPNRSIEAIKSVILDEIGADASADPKEWDEKVLTKLEIKASAARENIKNLLKGVELPKIETKEERDLRLAAENSKREQAAAPLKADFLKFDKLKVMDGLEYTVPEDYKSGLSSMFDSFIKSAGQEPTPEALETMKDLRDAFFFSANKDKIYEMMYKDAESKIKAELDKKLGNTEPPNTATASDQAGGALENTGVNYVRDQQGRGRPKTW